MPWTDNFDSETPGNPPANWVKVGSPSLLALVITNSVAYSAPNGMRVEQSPLTSVAYGLHAIKYRDDRPWYSRVFTDNLTDVRYIASSKSSTLVVGNEVAWLRLNQAKIEYYNSGWVDSGLTIDAKDFGQVKIWHDFAAQKYSATYNGKVICSDISFVNTASSIEGVAYGAEDGGLLIIDDVQIGDFPPREPGEYRATIITDSTPEVFESRTDNCLIDYDVLHRMSETSEAWLELEAEYANFIEEGFLLIIEVVPWGGTQFEQFFYGEILDKWPSSPNVVRIMAKDALAGVYDIDIDSVYYDTIHENQEYNIDPGATANDPPTVTLGPIHADMIKPIVRLQVLEVEDPIQRPTTWPGTPTSTTITQASGKTYIGTRFHAGASRYGFIGFEGVTDAAWDYLIVREGRYTGEPDLADVVYQKLNNAAIPGGGSHGILFSVDPGFRLNRGQPYWILIRPNNTGAAYNFTFYSSQPSTTNPGATGQGVISYHFPTTSWIWEQRDEVGHMIITQMKWTDVREGSQWTLVNQAGTAIIEFGGSEGFAPYWIYDSGASEYQNGARAFFFEGWVSGVELYLPLIDMIENKAQMVLSAPEGSDVPLIDAIESKVGQIIRRLMTENNWHIRQLHRYTDYPDYGAPVVWYVNPFLPVYLAKRPPAVRAELLSSSWTPVLSLKYGPDSTNPDEEARVIVHGLREEISTAYTSSRLLAKTVGDKIIFAEYHNHDLQLDLNGLQNKFTGFPTPFFKKVHLVKIADVPNFDELMALAERQSDLENLVLISGSLQVDGSTWVQPGDRITYETSRYGITPARRVPGDSCRIPPQSHGFVPDELGQQPR